MTRLHELRKLQVYLYLKRQLPQCPGLLDTLYTPTVADQRVLDALARVEHYGQQGYSMDWSVPTLTRPGGAFLAASVDYPGLDPQALYRWHRKLSTSFIKQGEIESVLAKDHRHYTRLPTSEDAHATTIECVSTGAK